MLTSLRRCQTTMTGRIASCLAIGLLLASVNSAHAQTFTQPATGTTGNWSTAANWNPAVPVSGNTTALLFRTFGGNANAFTLTNDLGAFTANSLTFANFGSGLFTTTATTALTMDGTTPFVNMNGAANVTIAGTGGVALASATTIGGSGNGALQLTGIVSGAGGLTINQTGNAIVSLTGANSFTNNVVLNNGYLQLGTSANALGNAANTLTINGGALRYSSGGTFANTIIANSDFVVAGGTGALTGTSTATIGPVTGAGGVRIITVGSSSGPTMSSANTYLGATLISAFLPSPTAITGALMTLSGANGTALNSPSFTMNNFGTLVLGGTAANANRIGDTAAVNLNGGRLTFTPVTAGTNENFGDLTISGTAHFAGTPTGVSTMTSTNFIRSNNATIIIDTSSYGTIQSATLANKLVFTGTNPSGDVFAVGSGTGQETGVLPYAVGGSSGNPSHFVTYDATNGLSVILRTDATRVLQQAPGAMSAATLLNKNVNFTGAGTYTFTGPYTINALSTTSSTVTFAGTGTITVAAGTLVNFDNFTVNGPTIDFGARRGYWFNSFPVTVTGTSSITGSNGLVISSGTATSMNFQNTVPNTFTGGLTLNGVINLGYTNDNQLGDPSGNVTMAGGSLWYNSAADYTFTRNINIESTNGGFGFNKNNSTASVGTATAATTITINGQVTGAGHFMKDGIGVINLNNPLNSYAGGTLITAGTLQYTVDSNLGAPNSRIILNGGTLQALATVNNNRPIQVNASSTLNAGAGVVATYSGALENVGALYGTAIPTLNITGAGSVELTGASPKMSGNVVLGAGSNLRVKGAGTLPLVSSFTVPATARMDIDDTTYTPNRFGPQSALSIGGGLVNYTAGATATGDPAQRMGNLIVTAAGSVLNIDAAAATSSSILRFNSLSITAGNITFRGTNLGDVAGNVARIFFDSFTTNQAVLPNVFWAGTSGTGTATAAAAYDTVRGIIQFVPVPTVGTSINNFAPDNVAITAAYTTTGDATASTGVHIYSLTLDGGSTVTLLGGNPADPINNNTPDGTLAIAGGFLTSQNGAKTITSAAARTVAFGGSIANINTTSDLIIDTNVSLTGTAGMVKDGAGALTVNGTYGITGLVTLNNGTLNLPAGLTTLNGLTYNAGTLNAPGLTTINTNGLTVNAALSLPTVTSIAGGLTVNAPTTLAATTTVTGNATVNSTVDFGANPITLTNLSGTAAGSVTSGGAVTVNSTANTAYAGTINSVNFVKSGGSQLTLTTAQNYTGTTTINGGVLLQGVNNALPNLPLTIGLITASDTTSQLNLGGFNLTVPSLTMTARGSGSVAVVTGAGVLTVNGNISYVDNTSAPGNAFPGNIAASVTAIDLGGAVQNINIAANNNAVDFTFNAPIQNGGVNYTGTNSTTVAGIPARLAYAANNTYAGGTTINSGTLIVNSGIAMAAPTGSLTVNTTGPAGTNSLLTLNSSQTVGSLAGSVSGGGTATINFAAAGTLTVNQAGNTSYDGLLTGGSGALTKTGAGTLALTGANTYGGGTQVNGGRLNVNNLTGSGTGTGAVTVGGGTLGGSGIISGAVAVNSGVLAPGNSPGLLTIGSGVTFTGGTFEVELQGTTPGGQYDQLLVTGGNVDLGLGVANISVLPSGYTPMISDVFVVINNTGLGTLSGTFAGFADQSVVASNVLGSGIDYLIYYGSYSGFPTSVVIAPVPEPATVLGICALGFGAAQMIRRRFKKTTLAA